MGLIVETVVEVREAVEAARAAGDVVGFVPTMGALHGGHVSIVRKAAAECGFVVLSIFVNPTQFAPGTDFEKYPRDLAGDSRRAAEAGADLIFAPSVEEMYPPGDSTFVEVTGPLVDCLCDPHRPGHFRGVTTVCARLFNIVGPDRAYFGEKDYQQLLVVEQMVQDLRFPLDIVRFPTVRESDGLAMSSRNAYLSPDERQAATALSRGLFAARDLFDSGKRDAPSVLAAARNVIDSEPLVRLQYLELRDAETLADVAHVGKDVVLALAAFVGQARLIDNVLLRPN
ncbi:MAG: pantoate--beta-alanine ligase [Armatimonadetes bacterium]|nr:pantoate--beta-alanine ligase [Armatimonadota bacterium]